jgi:hypothetical protein
MSDQQTAETAEAPAQQATEQATEQPKPTETVEFWKQKAREQEKRAKENAEAAKRLGEIDDATKSAEQKANDRLAEIERRATELAAKEARADVSATTGIPAALLAGPEDSTTEAVQAYADLLIAHMEAAGKPRAPKPDANQGRPGRGRSQVDRRLIREVLSRQSSRKVSHHGRC